MNFSTGNEIVDAVGQLHLEGNIVPHFWFEHIRFDNGKPDLPAIIILSEIVYWYRPTYIKDEITGQMVGVKKRFKSDLLQRTYESFSTQFGLTKRQVQDAVGRLEKKGLIQRHFRTIEGNHNVLFIELIYQNLIVITFQRNTSHVTTEGVSRSNGGGLTLEREGCPVRTEEVSRSNVRGVPLERGTYTEITTEITTENTTEREGGELRKDMHAPQPIEFELANLLFEKIRAVDPLYQKPDMHSWSNQIQLMLKDGRTASEIRNLIDWACNHPYWRTQILSTKQLRDKATHILLDMSAEQQKQQLARIKRNGRNEHVPDWFYKQGYTQIDQPVNAMDFETERQKVLEKLNVGN